MPPVHPVRARPAASGREEDAASGAPVQRFAPSAARKRSSPAARAVSVAGLPSAEVLRAAAAGSADGHLVHAPRAVVVAAAQ